MTVPGRDPREGVLERTDDERWRLRFERVVPHAPAKVWRAITEEDHLARWFPTMIEGERRTGAPLTFRFRGHEFPPSHGRMIECDPPHVLEFEWGESEEDMGHRERTRLELRPAGDGCHVTLLATYDLLGKSSRDAAGWHLCLDALEAELEDRPLPPSGPEQWKPMRKRYADRFPPEASTIGPPESMPEYRTES